MINKAFDRHLFTIGGAVKTSGGSLTLAKGQLAIVDLSQTTVDGAAALAGFLGHPKNKKDLAIRVGVSSKSPNRSYSDKAESTPAFALNEVKNLRVSVPERTEQSVDEVILGYDGFDASKAFAFKAGDANFRVSLELKGGLLDYRGGGENNTEIVHVDLDIADYDVFNNCADFDACAAVDCKSITLAAIEQLKRRQVTGGGTIEDFVEITPVFSCDTDVTATLIPYDYYTLDVCDTGGAEALALIQAQYTTPIIRINRKGSTSTYQVLLPQASGAPADYEQTVASLLKGCADCPAGYSAVEGGFLYAITIADGGADRTAIITASLANAKLVAGTVVRAEGNDGAVGFYTAIYSTPITQAEIDTFVNSTANNRDTATVAYVGVAQDICEDSTVTEATWVIGDTCNAVEETYTLVLPDNECGEDRLAELAARYPDLTIVISDSPTDSSRVLTLSGTSGTANVNVDGVDYLATFASDLETTADNFITAHSAAILTATGIVVSDGGVGELVFTGENALVDAITIDNVTLTLDGTLAASVPVDYRVNCSTQYETTIVSNLVCDECSPVFQDYYRTLAPESFFETMWVKVADATTGPAGNCLCGIRFKGRTFLMSSDEALRDVIGFTETSTMVRVSGGYPTEIREGIGYLPTSTYAVTQRSRWIPRTHLAGNLRDLEKEGRAYFLGEKYNHNYLTRVFRGETSNMEDQLMQMVHYTIEIGHEGYTQGFARTNSKNIEYHIWAELGRHFDVESILNDLASNAGVATVQATAV